MFHGETTDLKDAVGQAEPDKALVYFFVDLVTAPTNARRRRSKFGGSEQGEVVFLFPGRPGRTYACAERQSETFKKSSERVGEAGDDISSPGHDSFRAQAT